MYISPCEQYAYIAPPRTGSSSVGRWLLDGGWRRHHGHHKVDPELCKTIPNIFCTVRNHHDNLASWYFFDAHEWPCDHCEKLTREPFNRWVTRTMNEGFGARYRKFFPPPERGGTWRLFGLYRQYCNGVIHFENVEEEARAAFDRSAPDKPFPHFNRTEQKHGRPYQSFYSKPAFLIVSDTFRDEMEELGYSREWPGPVETPRSHLYVASATADINAS